MRQWINRLVSFGVLLILLAASIGGYFYLEGDNRAHSQRSFANAAEEVGVNRVERGLVFLENSLRSLRGLFAASVLVEEAEWETFAHTLEMGNPYSRQLTYVYWERNDAGAATTLRRKYVKSQEDDGELPEELGMSEERWAAVEKDMLATVWLDKGSSSGEGMILMMPVFVEDKTRTAEERQRWLGFVGVAMKKDDVFAYLLGEESGLYGNLRVVITRESGQLLFDTRPQGWPRTFLDRDNYLSVRGVAVGDDIWTLTMEAPATYELSMAQNLAPKAVLAFGALAAWLIFALFRMVGTAEEKAREAAEELAGRLAARERQQIYGAADPIVVLDIEGKFQSVNAAAVKLFGYPVERVMGRRFTELDFLSADMIQKAMVEFAKVRSGKYEPFEMEIARSDGEVLAVEISVSPVLEMKQPIGYQLIMRDVTERKKLLNLVRSEEKKFRKYIDTAGVMLLSLNMKGEVTLINKKGVELLGYREEEIVGKDWFDLCIPVEVRDQVREVFNRLMRGDLELVAVYRNAVVTKLGETRLIRFNNTVIYDDDGKIAGTLSSGEDITQEQKLQAELRKAKALDETLLEGIGEGIVAVDTQGKPIYINKQARELIMDKMGVRIEELSGLDWGKVFPNYNEKGEVIREEDRVAAVALRTGQIQTRTDRYIKDKNGLLVPLALVAAPIFEEGKPVGAVVSFRDITKEKEVERAKTEFVSMASHQLRTPLSVISWYTEMMLDEETGAITEDQRKYLTQIHLSNRRLIELVNALLNVSRIEMGTMTIEPKLMNLRQGAEEILTELKQKIAAKGLKVETEFDESIGEVSVDPNIYRIVLNNLLGNAVKYTNAGGRIKLTIKRSNGDFQISVADTGVGIPSKDQNLVFRKLFRADNAKSTDPEGTGLGLYIAKEAVGAYGGKIWFESKENQGSNFFFTIPGAGMAKRVGTKSLL